MVEAANAFAKSEATYKAVIFDDGHRPRELSDREQAMLVEVCARHGLEIEWHDDEAVD